MTSSSANKFANLVKELNREEKLLVDSVSFFNEKISLLASPSEKVMMSEGMKGEPSELTKIREAMMRVACF